VLRTVKRTLTQAGYRVIEAKDGLEAVEVFRARRAEIDLVFLDVLMPRLDGSKAKALIRAEAPDARVLLTSGYATPAMPDDSPEHSTLLSKPYRPDMLLRVVREALDAPPG